MSFSGDTAAGPEAPGQQQTTARQFLYVDDTGPERKLRLKEKVLQAFLESDDVSGKPVAVISVAGAFRTGKSYLLNEMSRYLTAENKGQWRDVKKGSFTWKNGADSHTNGMFISPPIKITLGSGEEGALFLLDTQGLFDDSNMSDATNIFALSTLLSSMQVFNLRGDLKSDDLDHLQLFAEIGSMARDRSDRTAFQNLLFLIRDWDHPDTNPFGKQGGDGLVQTRLSSDKADLNQRRQHIEQCFANIEGFLMPHPGKVVARSSAFSDGDIDEEFATHLDELLTLLLSPDKIPLKMNGNRPVTCGELATLIRRYAELFQSGKLPEPKSILQSLAEWCNTAAVETELSGYVRKMNDLLAKDAPLLTEEIFEQKHSEEKLAAIEALKNRDTVPDYTKSEDHYCSQLAEKIEQWLESAQKKITERCANDREKARMVNENLVRECIETFDASMRGLEGDELLGENKIKHRYFEAERVAIDHFTQRMISLGSYKPTDFKYKLEASLKERLGRMLARDEDLSNMAKVEEHFLKYRAQMETLLADGAPSLDRGILEGQHDKELRLALSALQPRISVKHSTNSEGHYSERLESKVLGWFQASQERFREKFNQDKMKADEVNCALATECLASFKHTLTAIKRDQAANKTEMQEAMEVAEQNVMQRFECEVVTFGSYNAEERRQQLLNNIKDASLKILETDDEKSNSAVVRDLLKQYSMTLVQLLADESLINSELITQTHSQAKQNALYALKGRLSLQHSTKTKCEYWHELHEEIDEWFIKSKNIFEDKCETQNVNVATNALDEFFESFQKKLPEVEENGYFSSRDEEKNIVLLDFSNQAASFGNYSAAGIRNRLDEILDLLADQMINREKARRKANWQMNLAKAGYLAGAAATVVSLGALAVVAAPVAVGAALVGAGAGATGMVGGAIGIFANHTPEDVRKEAFLDLMRKKEGDKESDTEAIKRILALTDKGSAKEDKDKEAAK
ncbi:uncharacterized protein LOC122373216 [Amphibalanus amphitrite]|uniref:uncharacterized protein LOC122373216 n=1 Tax=Amphibalanus amphitrite TaxID=1232801 RepID=UPI001C90F1DC|nr:uncharacterized protein LOC122373216 [Amphibalanus amphitrite]